MLIRVISAGVIAVVGYLVGTYHTEQRHVKRLSDAPTAYVNHIDALIQTACARDTPALAEAVAIVRTRNDLRSTLTSLAALLNSEIDRLESLTSGDTGADLSAIKQVLDVLRLKWPAKKTQVEIELRKLIAELGLVPE